METMSCLIFEFESSKFVSEILLSVLWDISITLCLSMMQSLSRFKVEGLFGLYLLYYYKAYLLSHLPLHHVAPRFHELSFMLCSLSHSVNNTGVISNRSECNSIEREKNGFSDQRSSGI